MVISRAFSKSLEYFEMTFCLKNNAILLGFWKSLREEKEVECSFQNNIILQIFICSLSVSGRGRRGSKGFHVQPFGRDLGML